ncbi:NAD-dependent epimerase/dehydratase family protein [Aestuariirhabdus sp. LZHN29]|uniref:NAD-dependent epimerase/dehydratase family protein n=1 Tax=Aestuariirhabdus sp. LZHN29 TaxID=3417462 RepID=UPI003CF6948A
MKRLLLTGGTGFIGSALLHRLLGEGEWEVMAAVRRSSDKPLPSGCTPLLISDMGDANAWDGCNMQAVQCVVHCAAKVHDSGPLTREVEAEYRRVNAEGTMALARKALAAGVRRFVYISTVKVYGAASREGEPFCAEDEARPEDSYAASKLAGERALRSVAAGTQMEVVIVRPVLVYGPGVKANFASMLRWVYRGVPLPLGAISNRRSLVAIDNLVDLIVTCLVHPGAANEIFLVSDNDDLSTPELIRRTAMALGRGANLLPVPPLLLTLGARLAGKPQIAMRLMESLQVDIAKTQNRLGWQPPVTMEHALRRTAAAFLEKPS